LTPFYNPRTQHWNLHFNLEGAQIIPLTPIGRVTIAILQINHPERVLERQHLIQAGKYPRSSQG
jgi:hypothetical protein